jgi:hypothetical protein
MSAEKITFTSMTPAILFIPNETLRNGGRQKMTGIGEKYME